MNDNPEPVDSPETEVTGNEARRRFVKNSGGMALAAPAVILLLSAHSKNALATKGQYNTPKSPPPKKNLLDP
jgi:hypothetical protein